MTKTCYLFFGFAAEYVLNPLYFFMKNRGYDCIEIDLFSTKNARQIIHLLKNRKIVFINSAHLFFDKANFFASYQKDVDIVSPLELIDYLNPVSNVYVPHDLSQPVHEKEQPWLDLFDLILMPREVLSATSSHTFAVNAGWIKRNKLVQRVSSDISRAIGFALSDFEYYRRLGPENTYEFWRIILDKGVTIKFPYWPDVDIFERYFQSRGVNIFPSTSSLSDFIDMHGVIICNGSSSVNTEAALSGRKVINVLYKNYNEHSLIAVLGYLPNMQYVILEDCADYIDKILDGDQYYEELIQPQIEPFNFSMVSKLLTDIA